MKNKILSILLAFILIINVVAPVFAKEGIDASNDSQQLTTKERENYIDIDITNLVKTEAEKQASDSKRVFRLFTNKTSATGDIKVKVNLKTIGLHGQEFDTTILDKVWPSMKLTPIVTYRAKQPVELAAISNPFSYTDREEIITIPRNVLTEYTNIAVRLNLSDVASDTIAGNADIRAYENTGQLIPGTPGPTIDIEIYQIASTKLNIEYQDIYGKTITDLSRIPAIPQDTKLKFVFDETEGIDFETTLPKENGEQNYKLEIDDQLGYLEDLHYPDMANATILINDANQGTLNLGAATTNDQVDVEYKTTYDVINGGTVILTVKDKVLPKDPTKPTPQGYNDVKFISGDGYFENSSNKREEKAYIVKEGSTWDDFRKTVAELPTVNHVNNATLKNWTVEGITGTEKVDSESYKTLTGTITQSVTFTANFEKPVYDFEIVTDPTKMDYTVGDKLDPTGMSVKITYTDGTSEVIDYKVTGTTEAPSDSFKDAGITLEPSKDDVLKTEHNGKNVVAKITRNNKELKDTTTKTLTVTSLLNENTLKVELNDLRHGDQTVTGTLKLDLSTVDQEKHDLAKAEFANLLNEKVIVSGGNDTDQTNEIGKGYVTSIATDGLSATYTAYINKDYINNALYNSLEQTWKEQAKDGKLLAGLDLFTVVKENFKSEPKKVALNPDDLNTILPTADEVLKNFKDKAGVDKDKYQKLVEEVNKGKALLNPDTNLPKDTVTVDKDGQTKLDTAYENIKKAIEALTGNNLPTVEGPANKTIIKGDALDLDKNVVVDVQATADQTPANGYVVLKDGDNVKADTAAQPQVQEKIDLKEQTGGKYYTLKIVDAKGAVVTADKAKDTPGTYTVTYTVEDAKGATASHDMTLVVQKDVIEVPGDFPAEIPDGYVKVEFKSGDNGGLQGTTKFLVKKDSTKDKVQVPTIVPKTGFKVKEANGGWDKPIPETFTSNFEATAQYETLSDTSETPVPGYSKITFDALDKGKIGQGTTKVIYVNPEKEVTLKAPTVTPNTGYTHTGWDPAIDTAKKYVNDERIIATYTADDLISETEKEGYIKVTFAQGKNGQFTDSQAKKDFWVKPDTLVDLRAKAPQVTANAGYVHTGWDKDLVVNYPAQTEAQTIIAQYELDTDFSDKEKPGYTKITFAKGDHGEFVNGAKTEIWVNQAKDLTLPAPGIIPHAGYSHTGWKDASGAVDLSQAKKYTTESTITATYTSDISDTEKDGFVKVTFKPGNNGTFADNALEKAVWVNPNKEVNLTKKAPAVTAKSGYIFTKWDHDLVATFKVPTDITAQYASAGDIKTEETEGFTKVTFDKGDHGEFVKDAITVYWVNPEKELVLPAPGIVAGKGYTHTGWEPALTPAKKYAVETTVKASYQADSSETEVTGFNKVTFETDANDGTFEGGKTTKDVWVKPDTIVDLTDKVPTVTAKEGKTHTGWDRALVDTFANGSKIKAAYASDVSDKPVPGWTEITFKQGDHGKFADGAKNVLWVNPAKAVALDKAAPQINPDVNYSFDKWVDKQGVDANLSMPKEYKVATSFTATYESDFSDTPKAGFVKVTFKPGENGKFAPNSNTETYVRANKEVDLTEKAPTVIPNQNYGHSGWQPALKGTFSSETDIVAQYKQGTFDENNIKEIIVVGPTKMSYTEGEKLDLSSLKIIAKDNAGLLKTYDGVEAIKGAGFTINPENGTSLRVDTHNDKPIEVAKNGVKGTTVTKLTVKKLKTQIPTDVLAANQGDKTTTTVKGKVVRGAKVKIYDENGNDITPTSGVTVDPVTGEFTAEVTKQEVGKKVKVTAQKDGEIESQPQEAVVFRDKNSDWKDDGTGGLTLEKPQVDPIKEGDTEVKVKKPTDETIKKIIVQDAEGNQVVAEKDDTGTWKVDGQPVTEDNGKLVIPAEEPINFKENTIAKVIFEDGESPANKSETPVAIAPRDTSSKPTDVVVENKAATPDKTTVTGKAKPGAVIKITDKDGNDLTDGTEIKADPTNGTFTVDLKDKQKPGTVVKVTATEPGKKESTPVIAQVKGNEDVVENNGTNPKPAGFKDVKFIIDAADKAKGNLEGASAFYVNPAVAVKLNPPTVKPATGYKLDKWVNKLDERDVFDSNVSRKYDAEETTFKAVFKEVADYVEAGPGVEKPAGYSEVRFAVDTTKAEFTSDSKTIYYVNPNKEIALPVPTVNITDNKYTHTGWDKDLDSTDESKILATKYDQDTTITATLTGLNVETPEVDDIVTGDTTVKVNPKDADKITIVVDDGTKVVAEKGKDGNWTANGQPVPTEGDKLVITVSEDGFKEKALIEVTTSKDGVDSAKVAKTAEKVIQLTVEILANGQKSLTVTTNPPGARVKLMKGEQTISTGTTNSLGVTNLTIKDGAVKGEYYKIIAELEGYISKETYVDVR